MLLGAVHKGCPHKIEKIDPLSLVHNMSALAQLSLPLVRADTPQISKNLQFFASKSADVRI